MRQKFAALVQNMNSGSTLRDAWPLDGGVSAEIHALEYDDEDGTLHTAVVRRHGEVDLSANPHIARDEFNLLRIALHHGVRAPEPLYLDESTEIFPTPIVVVEFIEGRPDFEPFDLPHFLDQAACELVRIHSISADEEIAFLPDKSFQVAPATARLDDAMSEGLIRDALSAIGEVEYNNPWTLLHGDYWLGNWLWRNGRLQAIIDWEDAGVGDPLSDLANCRLELLWAIDESAMEQFTERYLAMAGLDVRLLPAWDLWAALRPCGVIHEWGLEPEELEMMRLQHRRFVERATRALADESR